MKFRKYWLWNQDESHSGGLGDAVHIYGGEIQGWLSSRCTGLGVIIVWPHIMLQNKYMLKLNGGKYRTTIVDIVSAPPPPLAADPRPSLLPWPDHNLRGWCYRKPDAPGEIELLHGDSSLFTSSLTGCLKMKRGRGCGLSWLVRFQLLNTKKKKVHL